MNLLEELRQIYNDNAAEKQSDDTSEAIKFITSALKEIAKDGIQGETLPISAFSNFTDWQVVVRHFTQNGLHAAINKKDGTITVSWGEKKKDGFYE